MLSNRLMSTLKDIALNMNKIYISKRSSSPYNVMTTKTHFTKL